jgi:3',5'-cyclic AMP phosphodiesterase CpdA
MCPGNHDVRDAYVAGLGRPAHEVVEAAGMRWVMLDSLVDARDGERVDEGFLPDDQLAWLDDALAATDLPAYVCLHHPPVTIGLELMEPIRLTNPDALAEVLRRHDHVRAVLVGHAHTMAATTFAGRPLLIGGGVVSTVTRDAEAVPALWYDAPPSFALHLVDDLGRITSHWRALPG